MRDACPSAELAAYRHPGERPWLTGVMLTAGSNLSGPPEVQAIGQMFFFFGWGKVGEDWGGTFLLFSVLLHTFRASHTQQFSLFFVVAASVPPLWHQS